MKISYAIPVCNEHIELEKLLDEQMESEIDKKTRTFPDKYKFIFDPQLGKLSTKPTNERVAGRKHLRFGNTRQNQNNDRGGVPEAMIKPGMGIVKILEDAVKGTRFFKSLIANFWDTYFGKIVVEDTRANTQEYFNTEEGQKELTKILNNNQQVPWFKVISTVHTNVDKGIDPITKMYSKTIIFKVVPYNFHVLKLLMPGMSIGKTDWDKYVRKSYNYLYTGDNIDIQRLRINYKTGFYQRNLIEVKTKDGFAQNIISAVTDFGKRWIGSQKEHPEPKFPLRSYPSLIKSDQQTKTGDSEELMVSEFFDYLVNPTADMIQVEMDVLGDPGLLAQDMYITLDGEYANKSAYVGNDAWSEELGCFNLEYQMPIINLNYRVPADVDVEKGLMFLPNRPNVDDNISFSGAYQITKVESRIENGQFIQTLTMTRLNNQQGIGRAPFSLSKGDTKVIYDKKKENIKKTDDVSEPNFETGMVN